MLEQITIWLSDCADYFVLLIAVAAFFVRNRNSFFQRLFIYCLIIGGLQLLTTIMAMNYLHNWYVYHVIGLVEIVFSFALYKALGLSVKWWMVFWLVIALYVTDSIWVSYHDTQLLKLDEDAEAYFINNFGLALSMLFTVALGINFLWKTYLKGTVKNITRYPYFYISAGMTFYGAGAFFTYLLSSDIAPKGIQDYIFHYSWMLVIAFTYIKFFFILLGLKFADNGK